MSRVDLSNDRFEMTSEGTLKISHVNINDSAKYVCKAENKYGEAVVVSAFVMVRAKTRVVKAPEHALFYQGNIVTLKKSVYVMAHNFRFVLP
jgi:hypothetical protein